MPTGYPREHEPREWILTKVCSKCGERRPWAMFAVRHRFEDGRVKSVQAWCRDCKNAIATLETRARYREHNRERIRIRENRWRRDRRRQARAEEGHHAMLVPARPFQEWLAAYVDGGGEFEALSKWSGVPDRSFRRILYGDQRRVSLILVDKVLTSMGCHVGSLYGEIDV